MFQLKSDATHNVQIRTVFCPTPNRCEADAAASSTSEPSFLSSDFLYTVQAGGGYGSATGVSADGTYAYKSTASGGAVNNYDVVGYYDDTTSPYSNTDCYAQVEAHVNIVWRDGFRSEGTLAAAKPVRRPCSEVS